MGEVVRLEDLRTPHQRVEYLRSLVSPKRKAEIIAERVRSGEVVDIRSMRGAMEYGDGWQRRCEALEDEISRLKAKL